MVISMMLEDLLIGLGCNLVMTAATVKTALALIEEHTFDAAMLDANLDGNSSDPIADVLASRHVPFFFATGYKNHNANGAHRERHVLRKPFKIQELEKSFLNILPPAD